MLDPWLCQHALCLWEKTQVVRRARRSKTPSPEWVAMGGAQVSEVEGSGCPQDGGGLIGSVQLPELKARHCTYGSGSRGSLASQPTYEMLQRALRGSQKHCGSTRGCAGGFLHHLQETATGISPLASGGAELGKHMIPPKSKFKCINLPYLTPP